MNVKIVREANDYVLKQEGWSFEDSLCLAPSPSAYKFVAAVAGDTLYFLTDNPDGVSHSSLFRQIGWSRKWAKDPAEVILYGAGYFVIGVPQRTAEYPVSVSRWFSGSLGEGKDYETPEENRSVIEKANQLLLKNHI